MKKFYELANEQNKSVNQIAKECKIKQQTLQRYLTGENKLSLDNAILLADYFNISIDELIGRCDDSTLLPLKEIY